MAEEGSALDLEGFEEQLQSLFKNGCSSHAVQVDGKTFCTEFRKLVEEYTCNWQTPLPQLRIFEIALCYFVRGPSFFPVGCDDVHYMLSSLALSVFELLLFFEKNDFNQDPLKNFIVTFQECHKSLARHQNVHLLEVSNSLQDGGPWGNSTLQAILTQSTLPQTEVDRYISSELPVLLELRLHYLLTCERVSEAMALAKCCSKCWKHYFFLQVYLTCLHKTSQHDLLSKEVAELNGKDAVHIICNMESEENDESLLLALTRVFLSQQLRRGDMDHLCDLVFIWSKLHVRVQTSKQVLLEESHELMRSATNVNSIFPFIRAILEELGKDGFQFCVELCTKALQSCLPCDVLTKSLIYKTIAGLFPNDLEMCRACALLVFFLEPTVETYKMVFLLYTYPDQEYHAEASPIGNHVRFETLQVLKKGLHFDPELWNLMALRTSCINLMSEKVESAALEEIMEDKWVPDYCSKYPTLHLNTHSSNFQQRTTVAHQAGAKKRQNKDDKNHMTGKRVKANSDKAVDHSVKKKGNLGSRAGKETESFRRSYWQLDKTEDGSQGYHGRITRLSEQKPTKRKIRKPRWLIEDSETLENNRTSRNKMRHQNNTPRGQVKKNSCKTQHPNPNQPSLGKRLGSGPVKNNTKHKASGVSRLKVKESDEHHKKLSMDITKPAPTPEVILELSLPDNEVMGSFSEETFHRQRGHPQMLLYKSTVKVPFKSQPEKPVHRKEVVLRSRDESTFVQNLHCYARRPKGKGVMSNIQASVSTITRSSVQSSPPKVPPGDLCEKPVVEMKVTIASQSPEAAAKLTQSHIEEMVSQTPESSQAPENPSARKNIQTILPATLKTEQKSKRSNVTNDTKDSKVNNLSNMEAPTTPSTSTPVSVSTITPSSVPSSPPKVPPSDLCEKPVVSVSTKLTESHIEEMVSQTPESSQAPENPSARENIQTVLPATLKTEQKSKISKVTNDTKDSKVTNNLSNMEAPITPSTSTSVSTITPSSALSSPPKVPPGDLCEKPVVEMKVTIASQSPEAASKLTQSHIGEMVSQTQATDKLSQMPSDEKVSKSTPRKSSHKPSLAEVTQSLAAQISKISPPAKKSPSITKVSKVTVANVTSQSPDPVATKAIPITEESLIDRDGEQKSDSLFPLSEKESPTPKESLIGGDIEQKSNSLLPLFENRKNTTAQSIADNPKEIASPLCAATSKAQNVAAVAVNLEDLNNESICVLGFAANEIPDVDSKELTTSTHDVTKGPTETHAIPHIQNEIGAFENTFTPEKTSEPEISNTNEHAIKDMCALTLRTEIVAELATEAEGLKELAKDYSNSEEVSSLLENPSNFPFKIQSTSSPSSNEQATPTTAEQEVKHEELNMEDSAVETPGSSDPVDVLQESEDVPQESEESKIEYCCTLCKKVLKGKHGIAHAMLHYRKDECMFCGMLFKNDLLAMMHLSEHLEKLKKHKEPGSESQENEAPETQGTCKDRMSAKAETSNMSSVPHRGRPRKPIVSSKCMTPPESTPSDHRKLRSKSKSNDDQSTQKRGQNMSKQCSGKTAVHKVNGHLITGQEDGNEGTKLDTRGRGTSKQSENNYHAQRPSDISEGDLLQERGEVEEESSTALLNIGKEAQSSPVKTEETEPQLVPNTEIKTNGGTVLENTAEAQERVWCPVEECTWNTIRSKCRVALLYHALDHHYGNLKPLELAFHVGKSQCHSCGRAVRSFLHYQHHVECHRLIPRHPCLHKGCGARFKTTHEMIRHSRKHNPLQALCCLPGCSSLFICRWKLNLHEREHYTPKPNKTEIKKTDAMKGNTISDMQLKNKPQGHKSKAPKTSLCSLPAKAVKRTQSFKATGRSRGQAPENPSPRKNIQTLLPVTIKTEQKFKRSKMTNDTKDSKGINDLSDMKAPTTPSTSTKKCRQKFKGQVVSKTHENPTSLVGTSCKVGNRLNIKHLIRGIKSQKRRGRPPGSLKLKSTKSEEKTVADEKSTKSVQMPVIDEKLKSKLKSVNDEEETAHENPTSSVVGTSCKVGDRLNEKHLIKSIKSNKRRGRPPKSEGKTVRRGRPPKSEGKTVADEKSPKSVQMPVIDEKLKSAKDEEKTDEKSKLTSTKSKEQPVTAGKLKSAKSKEKPVGDEKLKSTKSKKKPVNDEKLKSTKSKKPVINQEVRSNDISEPSLEASSLSPPTTSTAKETLALTDTEKPNKLLEQFAKARATANAKLRATAKKRSLSKDKNPPSTPTKKRKLQKVTSSNHTSPPTSPTAEETLELTVKEKSKKLAVTKKQKTSVKDESIPSTSKKKKTQKVINTSEPPKIKKRRSHKDPSTPLDLTQPTTSKAHAEGQQVTGLIKVAKSPAGKTGKPSLKEKKCVNNQESLSNERSMQSLEASCSDHTIPPIARTPEETQALSAKEEPTNFTEKPVSEGNVKSTKSMEEPVSEGKLKSTKSKKKPVSDEKLKSTKSNKKPVGDEKLKSTKSKKKSVSDEKLKSTKSKKKPLCDKKLKSTKSKKKPVGDEKLKSTKSKKPVINSQEVGSNDISESPVEAISSNHTSPPTTSTSEETLALTNKEKPNKLLEQFAKARATANAKSTAKATAKKRSLSKDKNPTSTPTKKRKLQNVTSSNRTSPPASPTAEETLDLTVKEKSKKLIVTKKQKTAINKDESIPSTSKKKKTQKVINTSEPPKIKKRRSHKDPSTPLDLAQPTTSKAPAEGQQVTGLIKVAKSPAGKTGKRSLKKKKCVNNQESLSKDISMQFVVASCSDHTIPPIATTPEETQTLSAREEPNKLSAKEEPNKLPAAKKPCVPKDKKCPSTPTKKKPQKVKSPSEPQKIKRKQSKDPSAQQEKVGKNPVEVVGEVSNPTSSITATTADGTLTLAAKEKAKKLVVEKKSCVPKETKPPSTPTKKKPEKVTSAAEPQTIKQKPREDPSTRNPVEATRGVHEAPLACSGSSPNGQVFAMKLENCQVKEEETDLKTPLLGKRPFTRPPPTAYLDECYTNMPKRRKALTMFHHESPDEDMSAAHSMPSPRQRCASCFISFSSMEELQTHQSEKKCSNLFGFDSDDDGN